MTKKINKSDNPISNICDILKKSDYNKERCVDYLNQNKNIILFLGIDEIGINECFYGNTEFGANGHDFRWTTLFGDRNVEDVLKTVSYILQNCENIKIIYTMDLHEYTFRGGIAGLISYIKKHKIDFFQTWYEGSDVYELNTIKDKLKIESPNTKFFTISHTIDDTKVKDYGEEKIYDILLYGNTRADAYPFRNRIKNFLEKNSKKYRVKIVKYGEFRGVELYKEINKSHLCVATLALGNYLVEKYFEIAGCYSLIIGDMPEQGKIIFKDNYIHIDDTFTDDQIIETIDNTLSNMSILSEKKNKIYDLIHKDYLKKNYFDKIYEKINELVNI